MVKQLWVEKYRPSTIDDYVFRDSRLEKQVRTWIKEKSFPNLLLYGGAGTGKSSLAQLLLSAVGVDDGDILYINASDATGVDNVRQQIQNFVSTIPMGDFKVVLLEEADHLSQSAQAALRRVMEDYTDSARFILTMNYRHKIIEPIISRTQEVAMKSLDEDSFKLRVAEILLSEDVAIDSEDVIDTYIRASFPDLRRCINMIQGNVQDGVLLAPDIHSEKSNDYQLVAVDLFKKGAITEARKLIVSQIRQEEYVEFFKLCYKNLDWWGKSGDLQDEALLIIRDALVKHSSVADPEINLSAMLVQLSRLGKK